MPKKKLGYILFCLSLFFIFDSCSSKYNNKVINNQLEDNKEHSKLESNINQELFDSLNEKLIYQNKKIDSLLVMVDFNNVKNHQSVVSLNDKIRGFNESLHYFDSLYINILSELSIIENTIVTLGKSYNEVAQIKTNNRIDEIPPISEDEYKQKYIEALEAYQNGDWEISLNGFSYLLTLNQNDDLSDNCQYWIAEIYFKMKKYHKSIEEYNVLLEKYPISNKIDDSLYKLGNCYMQLNNE